MSILIKGIKMPAKGEYELLLFCHSDGTATLEGFSTVFEGEPFEVIEVPPHGRLIDADALTETMGGIWDCNDLYFQPNDKICDPSDCKGCKWRETMDCCRRMVKHAPTIIEAEGGAAHD